MTSDDRRTHETQEARPESEGALFPDREDSGVQAERRYDDDEVRAILAKATETKADPSQSMMAGRGLTLAELEQIGREVGVDAHLIRRAALALDARPEIHPRRTVMGLPVGVGRTVDLPGRLGDREWERFVVDLRETFDARGRVRQEGSLRQWTNGNLQVLLEPTASGERVRLRTVSGRFRALLSMGTAATGMALFILVIAVLGVVDLAGVFPGVGALLGVAAWGFGSVALRSFRWASERERQMEAMGERAVELASGGDEDSVGLAGPPSGGLLPEPGS